MVSRPLKGSASHSRQAGSASHLPVNKFFSHGLFSCLLAVRWGLQPRARGMPKPKHRRKPGGKAVPNPGRGRPGKPLREWLNDPKAEAEEPDTAGLPLFDW